MTRTYTTLDVSPATFQELASKLRAAGYGHAFDSETGEIDMSSINLFQAPGDAGLDVTSAAGALVQTAAAQKLVLTIEQRSLQPLAMDNYETVVTVRSARGAA